MLTSTDTYRPTPAASTSSIDSITKLTLFAASPTNHHHHHHHHATSSKAAAPSEFSFLFPVPFTPNNNVNHAHELVPSLHSSSSKDGWENHRNPLGSQPSHASLTSCPEAQNASSVVTTGAETDTSHRTPTPTPHTSPDTTTQAKSSKRPSAHRKQSRGSRTKTSEKSHPSSAHLSGSKTVSTQEQASKIACSKEDDPTLPPKKRRNPSTDQTPYLPPATDATCPAEPYEPSASRASSIASTSSTTPSTEYPSDTDPSVQVGSSHKGRAAKPCVAQPLQKQAMQPQQQGLPVCGSTTGFEESMGMKSLLPSWLHDISEHSMGVPPFSTPSTFHSAMMGSSMHLELLDKTALWHSAASSLVHDPNSSAAALSQPVSAPPCEPTHAPCAHIKSARKHGRARPASAKRSAKIDPKAIEKRSRRATRPKDKGEEASPMQAAVSSTQAKSTAKPAGKFPQGIEGGPMQHVADPSQTRGRGSKVNKSSDRSDSGTAPCTNSTDTKIGTQENGKETLAPATQAQVSRDTHPTPRNHPSTCVRTEPDPPFSLAAGYFPISPFLPYPVSWPPPVAFPNALAPGLYAAAFHDALPAAPCVPPVGVQWPESGCPPSRIATPVYASPKPTPVDRTHTQSRAARETTGAERVRGTARNGSPHADTKRVRREPVLRKTKQKRSERRFSCHICDQNFKRSEHLKRHLRIHTGERHNLTQHLKIHSKPILHPSTLPFSEQMYPAPPYVPPGMVLSWIPVLSPLPPPLSMENLSYTVNPTEVPFSSTQETAETF